jgi:hypothetical protein
MSPPRKRFPAIAILVASSIAAALPMTGCDDERALGSAPAAGAGGAAAPETGSGGAAGSAPVAPAPSGPPLSGVPPVEQPQVTPAPTPSGCTFTPADPQVTSTTVQTPGCRCTRRPGPGHSWECAVGAGESVTQTIGPEGGTVQLVGQQGKSSGVPFSISLPPGALAAPTTITITETTLPPPSAFIDYSPVYLVEPLGLPLEKLAFVKIPWGSTQGLQECGIAIYTRAESGDCAFAPLGDSYVNAGFNQGSIDHLGYLFVAAPRTNPICP